MSSDTPSGASSAPTPGAAPGTPGEPRKRRIWPWIVAGVFVVFVVGCVAIVATIDEAGEEVSEEIEEESREEASDVTGDVADFECTEDSIGLLARGTLTNQSSERSSYIIDVTFEDSNRTQVATATAFVDNVAPGQQANWEAHSGQSYEGEFTCEVVDVERFASV